MGWGGQEIRILQECVQLKKLGYTVRILANSDSQIIRNAPVYGVDAESVAMTRKRPKELLAMINKLRKIKPEIIFTHSSTDHWLVAIARIFLKETTKIIRTRHVSALVHRNIATRWLYNSGCDSIMTTGETIRRHLISDGFVPVDKVFTVPTGIDLNYFKAQNRLLARQTLGISVSTKVICNVGTLRSWKGQDILIKSFSGLESQDSILIIVGDGPMMATLQKLIGELGCADRVILAGQQADVRPYLDAADLFVFPSFANEGVPQAILQAMAFGLTIVTTRFGAIPEALLGYSAAHFVPEQNPQALQRELDRLIGSKDLRRTVVDPAISERIGLTKMTQGVIRTIQATVSPKKPLVSAYLIGHSLAPSSRRRFVQFESRLEEQFEIRRHEVTRQVSWREIFRQPSIIFLQKALPRLSFWFFLRPFLRAQIIFDYDDAIWESPKKQRSRVTSLRNWARLAAVKHWCAAVVAPSDYLLSAAGIPRRKRVRIPMAVEAQGAGNCNFRFQKPSDLTLSFGWAGHPQSHYLIESVSASLKTIFAGEQSAKLIVLSGQPPDLGFHYEWLPYSRENEDRFFDQIDVGLVPLSTNAFDKGKSPIKILQHFSKGATVIYCGEGAVSEICNNKNSYQIESFSQLGALIRSIDINRGLLREKQKSAFYTFQSAFSIDKVYPAYQALFNRHQR